MSAVTTPSGEHPVGFAAFGAPRLLDGTRP